MGPDYLKPCSNCHGGGQIRRQVRLPWLLHDQDPPEACYQGWREGGLRQDGDGEGEARKDNREGVSRCGFEEEHLRCAKSSCLSIFRETLTGLTVQNARQGSGRQFLYTSFRMSGCPTK